MEHPSTVDPSRAVGLLHRASAQEVQSDPAVIEVAQILRRHHDTVAAWEPDVEPTWIASSDALSP